VTIDQAHVGVTAVLWIVGFFYIAHTLPKVSQVRRPSYILALPLWAGWAAIYIYAFLTNDFAQGTQLSVLAIGFRALVFGIALEGIMVPFIDRLELRNRPQEIRIQPEDPE